MASPGAQVEHTWTDIGAHFCFLPRGGRLVEEGRGKARVG